MTLRSLNDRKGLVRLLVQLALLVVLFALNLFDENIFLVVVALALLVIPPVNWTVAGILIWTSRQAPHVESLRERADDAVTLALVSTAAAVGAAVGIARVFGVDVSTLGRPVIVLLAFGFILVALPAIDWLRTWRDVWLPMVYDDSNPKAEESIP